MARAEMVENGLKFLRHPNVQATPLSERVSFLEQKGMTKDEIQEALERYQSEPESATPATPAQAVVAAAPMVAAVAGPVQQLARRRMPTYMRVLLTVSSVVGAATLLGFLWNYMAHAGFFPWLSPSRRLLEAPKPDEEDAEKEKQHESALLTSLESVSTAIQSQTQELNRLCTAIDSKEDELTRSRTAKSHITSSIAEQATVQAIAELKAEVSTLKALLVASTSGVAVVAGANALATTSTGSGGGQAISSASAVSSATTATPPAAAEPVVAEPSAAERMMTALKKFRQENTTEQLKSASGILIMYVKNLVENPDVPRYRRIATTNANFKQKIEPLKHHDELLKSIGFAPSGLNMEWTWHHINRDEHIAILKALLKALQAVSNAKSNDPLALEEIAQRSMDEFYAQEKKVKTEETSTSTTAAADSSSTTTSTTTTTTVEKTFTTATKSATVDTDLQSFLSRLEQKTGKSLEDKTSVLAAAADANKSTEAAGSTEVDLEEEKAPVPVTADAATAAPTNGEPPYPKSFTEVMELIKKGEPVPGIQQIEERISDDAAKFLSDNETNATAPMAASAAVPAKPWEKR